MSTLIKCGMWASLVVYTCVLLTIEACTSQDYVRHFLSDVEGPVPFFAVNTTFSVSLLWAAALVFAICAVCANGVPHAAKLRTFFVSQALVFAFLGFDDRFKFHERLAFRLDIGDHFVLLAVALLEIGLLATLGRQYVFRHRAGRRLLVACLLFAVMFFIDACLPHDMAMRLSLEDLAKTWSAVFFFLFAWEILGDCLRSLKGASGGVFPQHQLPADVPC